MQKLAASSLASVLIAGQMLSPVAAHASDPTVTPPLRPIKHLVVIFQENVSFDHYFGTYPVATNPAGEPAFTPGNLTPTVNGLSHFPDRSTTRTSTPSMEQAPPTPSGWIAARPRPPTRTTITLPNSKPLTTA